MNTPKHALLLALSGATIALAAPAGALGDQLSQSYGPGLHQFTVPTGVTALSVTVDGGGGGHDGGANGCVPGAGAGITGQIQVVPGQVLTLDVGHVGGDAHGATGGSGGASGGAPGGSATASGGFGGGGGGGQSMIESPSGAVVVAGGGGGCGGSADGTIGDGGNDGSPGQGAQPGAGASGGGAGGSTAGAGGAGAPSSAPAGGSGAQGAGGAGAAADQLGGGGGGSGYPYGGGGGGGTASGFGIAGGGGGGGDYAAPDSRVTITPGANAGDGSVTVGWTAAGTGVGQLFDPTVGTKAMPDTLLLNDPVGTPGSGVVTADGVITRWAYQSGADAPSSVEFKVAQGAPLAASGIGNYQIVAEATSTGSIPANQITSWPARIPVRAGETIGAFINGVNDLGQPRSGAHGAAGVRGDRHVGDPAIGYAPGDDGSLLGFGPVYGAAVPLEAFVEPDTDGDGFGDISQDQCAGDPGSVQGCPVADMGVTSTSTTVAGAVTYKLTVTNHGPDPAPQTSLNDALSPGAVAVATSQTGTCAGTSPVRCTIPALPSGQSATLSITVLPPPSGQVTSTATVIGPHVPAGIGAGDLNPANNTAVTTVNVPVPAGGSQPAPGSGTQPTPGSGTQPTPAGGAGTPKGKGARFTGVTIRLTGPLTVHGALARLRLVTATAARGTVTVTSGHVRLARVPFTLNRTGQITVRLSRAGLTLLRGHRHGVRVRVVVASHTTSGASATTLASALMRAAA